MVSYAVVVPNRNGRMAMAYAPLPAPRVTKGADSELIQTERASAIPPGCEAMLFGLAYRQVIILSFLVMAAADFPHGPVLMLAGPSEEIERKRSGAIASNIYVLALVIGMGLCVRRSAPQGKVIALTHEHLCSPRICAQVQSSGAAERVVAPSLYPLALDDPHMIVVAPAPKYSPGEVVMKQVAA
ncbi:MAG: hypothetical protein SGPRY_000894 [Prymnesium sp.]